MIVVHVITGLGNGGAEAVLFRLVERDIRVENVHHVISLSGLGIYGERLKKLGVDVYALELSTKRFNLSRLWLLFVLLKRINPDVVQTWMYHADLIGGLFAWLAGIRSIVWGIRHSNLDKRRNSRSTLLIVRLCMFVSRWLPRRIVSCSVEASRTHQAFGYWPENFVHIPNGYSMERLKPDLAARQLIRAELNIAVDAFVVGMVARFDIQKDHRNLLRALGLLKLRGVQFTCLLVGVGVERGNKLLCSWIEEAGISDDVRLLGPRGDIPAVMNALDVHGLSSLGEAFPNVLAEAMACGTPCVTTDVGDAAVIVGQHGWVVVPEDAVALANGLTQAYDIFSNKKPEWQRLGGACRSHIMANFDLELMCERYRAVWSSCMRD